MLIDFVKSEEINYLEEIMKFASGLQLNLNKNIFFFYFILFIILQSAKILLLPSKNEKNNATIKNITLSLPIQFLVSCN